VSDLCATWNNTNGKCLTCYVGYSGPVNGVCSGSGNGKNGTGNNGTIVGGSNDDPNCQCHNDDKSCKKCYSGYILQNGSCVVDLCISYGFLNEAGT